MPHKKIIMHLGGSDKTAKLLRQHTTQFPDALIEEVNIKSRHRLPLLPQGVTHKQQDFLAALKEKPDNSVDQIHSVMALGYYRKALHYLKIPFHARIIPFLSERSRAATRYANKVLKLAHKKLKPGGTIEIIVANCKDTYCLTNGFLNIMKAIENTPFEKDKIKVKEIPVPETRHLDYWVADVHETIHNQKTTPLVYKITLTK